jgi:hypothetical protein
MFRLFESRMSRFGRSAGLAALCLAAAMPAAPATLVQLSMDQMTQSATAIVRATVASSYAGYSGTTIYTHYKLQVSETWKGNPPAEVMLPGGAANGRRQSFPGVPELQPGTEYVMFLWVAPSTGITHLLGLTQGLFNVAIRPDGSVLATRPQIGELILDANGRKVADHGVSMQFSDMKAQVRAMAAKAAGRADGGVR